MINEKFFIEIINEYGDYCIVEPFINLPQALDGYDLTFVEKNQILLIFKCDPPVLKIAIKAESEDVRYENTRQISAESGIKFQIVDDVVKMYTSALSYCNNCREYYFKHCNDLQKYKKCSTRYTKQIKVNTENAVICKIINFLSIDSDLDNPIAQYCMGLMYASGTYVGKNYCTAIDYFNKSKEYLNESNYALGELYYYFFKSNLICDDTGDPEYPYYFLKSNQNQESLHFMLLSLNHFYVYWKNEQDKVVDNPFVQDKIQQAYDTFLELLNYDEDLVNGMIDCSLEETGHFPDFMFDRILDNLDENTVTNAYYLNPEYWCWDLSNLTESMLELRKSKSVKLRDFFYSVFGYLCQLLVNDYTYVSEPYPVYVLDFIEYFSDVFTKEHNLNLVCDYMEAKCVNKHNPECDELDNLKTVLEIHSESEVASLLKFVEIEKIIEKANYGDAYYQYVLALCYLEGKYVKEDRDEGIHWLEVSSDNGLKLAELTLADLVNDEEGDCLMDIHPQHTSFFKDPESILRQSAVFKDYEGYFNYTKVVQTNVRANKRF